MSPRHAIELLPGVDAKAVKIFKKLGLRSIEDFVADGGRVAPVIAKQAVGLTAKKVTTKLLPSAQFSLLENVPPILGKVLVDKGFHTFRSLVVASPLDLVSALKNLENPLTVEDVLRLQLAAARAILFTRYLVYVVDEKGKPIKRASATISRIDYPPTAATVKLKTDEQGCFITPNLPRGQSATISIHHRKHHRTVWLHPTSGGVIQKVTVRWGSWLPRGQASPTPIRPRLLSGREIPLILPLGALNKLPDGSTLLVGRRDKLGRYGVALNRRDLKANSMVIRTARIPQAQLPKGITTGCILTVDRGILRKLSASEKRGELDMRGFWRKVPSK